MNPKTLKELKIKVKKRDAKSRREAIGELSNLSSRDSLDVLLDRIDDPVDVNHVISALSSLKDSRATFPLINFYNLIDDVDVKRQIINYMAYVKDPRAEEFLKTLQDSDIVDFALKNLTDNKFFDYTFIGNDAAFKEAQKKRARILLNGKNLTINEELIAEQWANQRPQTYIVDKLNRFFIGGHVHEHVQVAYGENLLAAGEVTFEREGDSWKVDHISNRSNGYYPHPCSFFWIKSYFSDSDVILDKDDFDPIYPRDGFNNDPDFLGLFKFGKYFNNS